MLRLKESGVVVLQSKNESCVEEHVKKSLPIPYPSKIRKFTLRGSFEERLSNVGNVDNGTELTQWSYVTNVKKDIIFGVLSTR